jgi:hypothetical protein
VGWDKAPGAGESGETEGKRAGDDAHLHAELRQWAAATERQRSGETAASPSVATKTGQARASRQRGGGCGTCRA